MYKKISAALGLAVMWGSLAFAGQAPTATPPATPAPGSGAPQSTATPPQTPSDGTSSAAKTHKKHKKHHKKHATTQTPPASPEAPK
jgi:hypothetical protein